MKPRECETVPLKSLHERFAVVGTVKHVTPDEAKFLIAQGMAVAIDGEEPAQVKKYMHREMRATGTRKA